jgi:hypothetical protein
VAATLRQQVSMFMRCCAVVAGIMLTGRVLLLLEVGGWADPSPMVAEVRGCGRMRWEDETRFKVGANTIRRPRFEGGKRCDSRGRVDESAVTSACMQTRNGPPFTLTC